uniref:Uncharacterized protein n=1 Tax=Trypanosoma congolense (strain IL3000) TaxID=1068625 RepID=G0USU4_TRYCI|nr:hypothetical protein, unlikely [Trypanosoma congolense IL3000]
MEGSLTYTDGKHRTKACVKPMYSLSETKGESPGSLRRCYSQLGTQRHSGFAVLRLRAINWAGAMNLVMLTVLCMRRSLILIAPCQPKVYPSEERKRETLSSYPVVSIFLNLFALS